MPCAKMATDNNDYGDDDYYLDDELYDHDVVGICFEDDAVDGPPLHGSATAHG